MKYNLLDVEHLPNGISVYKLPYDEEFPWFASFRIGPWCYSQADKTRELAIAKLFNHMQEKKVLWEQDLKHDTYRLETLIEFLHVKGDNIRVYKVSHDWVASIDIGSWHYSQRGETKEIVIENLFTYMCRLRDEYPKYLQSDKERMETVNKFLETQ